MRIGRWAKRLGKKFVLYSVGMNRDLNPAHHRLKPGRKMTVLRTLERLLPFRVDLVDLYETSLASRTRRQIRATLNGADLVVVRDEPTRQLLSTLGVHREIHVTADPALCLPLAPRRRVERIWREQQLWTDARPRIGIGISSQRPVRHPDQVAALADALVERYQAHILFIPINQTTDGVPMSRIQQRMRHRNESKLLQGCFQPEEVAAIAGKMSLVISSRLHLLVLASISGVPGVGISTRTKLDNFLGLFGEKPCGTVAEFDLPGAVATCQRLLAEPDRYSAKVQLVVGALRARTTANASLLRHHVEQWFSLSDRIAHLPRHRQAGAGQGTNVKSLARIFALLSVSRIDFGTTDAQNQPS